MDKTDLPIIPGVLRAGANWLLERWLEVLTSVIESMTEEHPSMTWSLDGEEEIGDRALFLEIRFSPSPDPLCWIGIPEAVYQDLGGRVLTGAGLDSSDNEEKRSTCLEMVEQSIGGLAGALTVRLAKEVTRETSQVCSFFPSGLQVIRVTVVIGDRTLPSLWIAFNPLIASWVEEDPSKNAAPDPAQQVQATALFEAPPSSRTFELLLDVALPVSVSFGKTELAIKEVLKLTTGSIVELNRSVSEPVDVIVNSTTIARGEVVVVDGNYGVRILSIVSRKERLHMGTEAVAETRTRVT